MDLLLTETAHRHFGERVADVAPGARLLRVQADGSLLDGAGTVVPVAKARPEVAWLSAEMFDEDTVRPFFRLLLRAETLRWIQSPAAGLDAPVWRTFLERGTRLTSSHVNSIPIAEFVLAAVLRHYQAPERWQAAQAARRWETPARFREVHGTTWVVVGLGAIGTAVATRATAFGAHVVGVRRRPSGTEPVEAVALADVHDQLPAADVVVLASPATPEARGLVDERFLAAMSPESVLVNISRGSAVDEAALLASLERGVPERAILDVFDTEPLPEDSPLWGHPRVWITPHASASGLGSLTRGADLFLDNLRRWLGGEPLLHEVDMAAVTEQQAG